MWHEARRQERLIRGMMVDYKKRAERRREYYEKIKQDPTQFLRIHARASKIHLDPAVATAAESPVTMMPWQGDPSHQIDRFDVRAHLDYIPQRPAELPTLDEIREEQRCNYERYRTLVHNDYAGISEEQCLQQIYVEEMFPEIQKRPGEEKEKLAAMRAAIGFSYDEGGGSNISAASKEEEEEEDEEQESDSDSDMSFSEIDLDVVIDVGDLNRDQKTQLNVIGEKYCMAPEAFVKMLDREKEEADEMKQAKEDEEEKAMYSGRKSRRERRAIIERKLKERKTGGNSPPSYAARGSPTYDPYPSRYSRSSSSSRDNSPEQPGKVTFITSFGGDDGDDDDAKKDKKSEKQSSSGRTSSSSSSRTSSSKTRPGSAASSSSSHTPSTDSHSKSWSVSSHSMHFGKRDKNNLGKLKQTETLAKQWWLPHISVIGSCLFSHISKSYHEFDIP